MGGWAGMMVSFPSRFESAVVTEQYHSSKEVGGVIYILVGTSLFKASTISSFSSIIGTSFIVAQYYFIPSVRE